MKKSNKVYKINSESGFFSTLLKDFDKDRCRLDGLNYCSLGNGWEKLNFILYSAARKNSRQKLMVPDMSWTGVYNFIFKASLKEKIFPTLSDLVELLPVDLEGEEWLLINCLKTTVRYNEKKSKLIRSPETNQIFYIEHICIEDESVLDVGLFTISDSNRATIFATDCFKNYVESCGVSGISFKEIGEIVPT